MPWHARSCTTTYLFMLWRISELFCITPATLMVAVDRWIDLGGGMIWGVQYNHDWTVTVGIRLEIGQGREGRKAGPRFDETRLTYLHLHLHLHRVEHHLPRQHLLLRLARPHLHCLHVSRHAWAYMCKDESNVQSSDRHEHTIPSSLHPSTSTHPRTKSLARMLSAPRRLSPSLASFFISFTIFCSSRSISVLGLGRGSCAILFGVRGFISGACSVFG